jgi:hypothetical protein
VCVFFLIGYILYLNKRERISIRCTKAANNNETKHPDPKEKEPKLLQAPPLKNQKPSPEERQQDSDTKNAGNEQNMCTKTDLKAKKQSNKKA